ncbi:hypothetical protein KIS1582_5005 [Cytobacillus firmus]|uniref:Uncharacterized protein n=1 Tax=Cytobacillus firmus TaxID=1399 RepID=A0A800MRQ9_CYTFI|nr:hypothetical protein KIS1582_5005 [Cytobacillus firmus]
MSIRKPKIRKYYRKTLHILGFFFIVVLKPSLFLVAGYKISMNMNPLVM